MHVRGIAATTIDEVLASSATSKSQFYQHFDDKTGLVYDVISVRADEIFVVAAPATGEGRFLPGAVSLA